MPDTSDIDIPPAVVRAPFTPAQITRLQARQADPRVHAYTCGCGRALAPQTRGLVCPCGGEVQRWAHAADVD